MAGRSQLRKMWLHLSRLAAKQSGTGATATQALKKKPKKHERIFHGEQVRLALESELLTENYLPQPMSAMAKRLNYSDVPKE